MVPSDSWALNSGFSKGSPSVQRSRRNLVAKPFGLQKNYFSSSPPARKSGHKTKQGKTIYEHKLMIGTKTHNLGELRFKAHTEYDLPATITIARDAGKWFVSFSYAASDDLNLSESDLIARYSAMNA